ncbi:LacI family DNA-binding transcriptional regulator [Lentilactobacillus hilgardii]|uniref:LacI family DNA-binding transcriptional regulator n=1 Tax=Lentilactobacillus hilgardii TaxID=1588 RepID=UPI0021A8A991|nr:LacI family DNA-binding transcriptional regulator [Lentilactobacillus hilgardii]MCT3399987.1 LacI family transcriptional regulator [Lentilactobacillus hilgardii]
MANIRQIAKLAGVSTGTVSRILNHDQTFSVSTTTRNRVLNVAKSVNYTLKSEGAQEQSNKLRIAIITYLSETDEHRDPYFSAIKSGIESQANNWGIQVATEFRLSDSEINWEELEMYGAVVVIATLTDQVLSKINAHNSNVIIVNDYRYFQKYDVVRNDFFHQSRKVLNLMKNKGHSRISFIGGEITLIDQRGRAVSVIKDVREQEYLDWMKINHLEENIDVHIVDWTPSAAMDAMKKILKRHDLPSAILVASDPQAMGVYKAIQEAGLKIPKDIAIASFDDIEMSDFLVPSLTTVKPAVEEMGKAVVDLVRSRVVDGRKNAIQVELISELIVRDSV